MSPGPRVCGLLNTLFSLNTLVSSEEIWLCSEKLIEVDVEDGGVDVVGRIDQQ